MYSAYRASLVAQMVKEFTCNVGDLDSISGWEDPLEEGMATQVAKGQGPVLGPCILQYSWASLVAQLVKNLTAMQETWV